MAISIRFEDTETKQQHVFLALGVALRFLSRH